MLFITGRFIVHELVYRAKFTIFLSIPGRALQVGRLEKIMCYPCRTVARFT